MTKEEVREIVIEMFKEGVLILDHDEDRDLAYGYGGGMTQVVTDKISLVLTVEGKHEVISYLFIERPEPDCDC